MVYNVSKIWADPSHPKNQSKILGKYGLGFGNVSKNIWKCAGLPTWI